MEFILDPWPWYVSGPMIALVMFLLIFMGRRFGMSSNLETMCSMCGAGKTTSFYMIVGLINPLSGKIFLDDA